MAIYFQPSCYFFLCNIYSFLCFFLFDKCSFGMIISHTITLWINKLSASIWHTYLISKYNLRGHYCPSRFLIQMYILTSPKWHRSILSINLPPIYIYKYPIYNTYISMDNILFKKTKAIIHIDTSLVELLLREGHSGQNTHTKMNTSTYL